MEQTATDALAYLAHDLNAPARPELHFRFTARVERGEATVGRALDRPTSKGLRHPGRGRETPEILNLSSEDGCRLF